MTLFIIDSTPRDINTHCANCGDLLDEYEEPGFPCDECTECQPMDGWYSSWPKITEEGK